MSSSSSSFSSSESYSTSAGAKHGLKVTRSSQTRYASGGVDGFRFTLQAVDPVNMSAAVFRYLERPYNPLTGSTAYEFDGVCSSVDLEELPEGAPLPGAIPPFFRSSQVDLVVVSRHDADLLWDKIQSEITVLIETLDIMDDLGTVQTFSFGSEEG